MSKKKVVKNFPSPKSLNEEYQVTGFFFAFVTSPQEGLRQCHEWVKCRDFLPDAARAQITGDAFNIYNFKFSKRNPPIDLTKMRMLVSKERLDDKNIPDFKNKIAAALKLLNHYERLGGMPLTRVEEVDLEKPEKYKLIYMFTGSSEWMKSPILISMYSFLIRLGDKEISFKTHKELLEKFKALTSGPGQDNDIRYLKSSWNYMKDIVVNRANLFKAKDRKGFHDVFYKEIRKESFHDRMGLRALGLKTTADNELNERMRKLVGGKK